MTNKNALQLAQAEMAEINRTLNPPQEKIRGILLYTIVYRIYINEKETSEYKKRVGFCHLTDGTLTIPIGVVNADLMVKKALEEDRYEVGYEDYNNPTGKADIDGEKLEEMKLKSVTFHHIFIKEEYIEDIYVNFRKDRKIRLLTKQKGEQNG